MIDRLKDLQRLAIKKGIKLDEPFESEDGLNNDIKIFSASILQAHDYIQNIKNVTYELAAIRSNINSYHGIEGEKRLSEDLDRNTNIFQVNEKKMHQILEMLEEQVKESKKFDPNNENPETRIKINLLGSVIKQYEETCTKFQYGENEMKNLMQTRVIRDAEVALNRKLEPNEKEEVLLDPTKVQSFYQNKLTGSSHIQLRNFVNDLEDRYKDIQKLERSINQVHQLFIELSKLVQYQGEIVDNIEQNIRNAKDFVLQAEVDIVKSKKNMQSARKKKCCILIIVIVVVLVILGPTLGTTLSKA